MLPIGRGKVAGIFGPPFDKISSLLIITLIALFFYNLWAVVMSKIYLGVIAGEAAVALFVWEEDTE
ncbi:hypothetical protein, partial [Phascolarctobacterium succinatutens]|uniref:hypothetical protein n=1 Tax=Phascolarctobacterium succinatutens TaxID=626940 RepID=UPI0026F194CC